MFYVEHMKKWISSEYQECKAYFTWAQFNPILKEYLYKIVNEGQRTPKSGFFLKLIGMKAGLPDYHLPVANDRYHGLWLEMKKRNQINMAKRLTQSDWLEKLKKIGHYADYAYGWEHAAKITMDYLNNKI